MAQLEIPNRSLFRQPEVCEIASIQPYVLRSWEAEFPDLGVAKAEGGPRVYRRADVERVLRIKQLLYGEGLTLAGVRRKLIEEQPAGGGPDPALASIAELFGKDARERIQNVKRGLRELSAMLVASARRARRGRGRRFSPARGRCAEAEVQERGGGQEKAVGSEFSRTGRSVRLSAGPVVAVGFSRTISRRDVAQPGSAPDWGSGGRWFESSHPDQCSTGRFRRLRVGPFAFHSHEIHTKRPADGGGTIISTPAARECPSVPAYHHPLALV